MSVPVLIADDHPLFRAAMVQAISTQIGPEIYQADDFEQAWQVLRQTPRIELVFLDLNMPGADGLAGIAGLVTEFPDVQIVVVSAQEDPQVIHHSKTMGITGFIPKSTPLAEITQAVECILQGHDWYPANLPDSELSDEASQFTQRLTLLTPHQYKVLSMLANGLLNKQIAFELSISESTVKQHVSAVLKKLHLNNRTQAGVLFNQLLGKRSAG